MIFTNGCVWMFLPILSTHRVRRLLAPRGLKMKTNTHSCVVAFIFGVFIIYSPSGQCEEAKGENKALATLDQLGNVQKGVPFPSDNGDIIGDHLILQADAYGFRLPREPDGTRYCAYRKTRFLVTKDNYVRIYQVLPDTPKKSTIDHSACPDNSNMVTFDTLYIADDNTQKTMSYERTGFAFGTLVVPFKFRLGSEKKLVSSSTIAPYIGFRHHKLQGFSMDLMPVASAGLGIVPVFNSITKENETKAAFSTAIGLTLTSTKNSKFNAGLLVGKDFLGKSDRGIDPSVNKMWLSLWLGISN